jgi:hypothetical protein
MITKNSAESFITFLLSTDGNIKLMLKKAKANSPIKRFSIEISVTKLLKAERYESTVIRIKTATTNETIRLRINPLKTEFKSNPESN